jgi:uncharacterized protein (TIGR02099 family)
VLQRLTTWLWYSIVLLVLMLAIYSSFGRLLMSNLGRYQEQILSTVNARLDFVIEVDELSGSWSSLSPSIEARAVRIRGDEHAPVGLEFGEVSLQLDVLDTLLTLSPKLYILEVSGGKAHADIDAQGQLSLPGIPSSGQANFGAKFNDFIFNAERLTLNSFALELHTADAVRQSFIEATLRRDGTFRRVQVSLQAPDRKSWFRLAAEGEGDLGDFPRFSGLFHLKSEIGDLGLFPDLLAQAALEPLGGSLRSDLWLRVDKGEVQVATRFVGEGVEVRQLEEEARNVLFEHVGLVAAADYRDGEWQFRVRDMELLGAGRQVSINRLTGSYGDDSLSLRLADLELGTLSRYLERAGLLPETASEVLGKMSPEGVLETAEFTLTDLAGERDWLLSTNFRDLDVKPWKGAPGLVNATGYAELAALEGSVQLASSEFSMDFPSVYRDPLDYSSFSAELQWTVAEDAFRIRSGPFTGYAAEGEVRGLFALELPRIQTPVGSEMDLMVSLRDTHPDYRRKYLPYKLNPGLLRWLEPSIGEGRIHEAGFIFRGSLVRSPQRRTVQLFFNLTDTRVDYHPDWPALTDLDGIVLIDDSDVDVQGGRGKLLDSDVADVNVRIRQDQRKQLHLSVDAGMSGSAADGLEVVNTSPLRNQVGDSFADWQLDGGLQTRLKLEMNLSDASATPVVDLVTEWDQVNVDMGSLNLEVEDISGTLFYKTATGFRGDDFRGELWGRPMAATVSQGRAQGELAELDIAVRGQLAAESLRDWLDLDLLRLAQGETMAELHVLVPPAGGARLEGASLMEGVSLDLPSPWSKTAEEQREMRFEMPLAAGPRDLQIALDEQAYLSIHFGEEGVSGGNLGFGAPLELREEGRFLLGGDLSYMSWDDWNDFIDRYLVDDQPGAMMSSIHELKVGKLGIFGRELEQVLLSGTEFADSWRFDFSTDWAAGRLEIPDDYSRLDIDLERIDIAGFIAVLETDSGLFSGEDEFPPASVAIESLRNGEDEWGTLGFTLRQSGANLHFENIKGSLRQIQLGGEEGMRLDWLLGENERTRLLGTFSFANFGDVLKEYQYEEIVETTSGHAEIELAWPGSPGEFALVNTNGQMRLLVEDGRFLNTSGAASGTLRVVAILNLADVVSKLSLDLSNIYKSGVPFDSIKGELIFHDGIVDVPKIDVNGRASHFKFVGYADIREEKIDGELVATLPIASNLPWMFALVSGLPAAAGVYVISKLFDKQMDRFSSAVYSVRGPWGDPEVTFERIFSDTARERTAEVEVEEGAEVADAEVVEPEDSVTEDEPES